MISMVPNRRLTGEDRFNNTHLIGVPDSDQFDSLLKTSVIYGANASGKSNLLIGMSKMMGFVFESLNNINSNLNPISDPFAFSKTTLDAPSLFEIQIFIDSSLYRYGFEVKQKHVEAEWLYKDEKELFLREQQNVDVSDCFTEGKDKERQTREDTLFLSVCYSYNGPISKAVLAQFGKIRLRGEWTKSARFDHPANEYLQDETIIERLLNLIRLADPGIKEFNELREKITKLRRDPITNEVHSFEGEKLAYEAIYETTDIKNSLSLDNLSSGTRMMLYTAGEILRAIDDDKILVIDEIDIKLHPMLIEVLLEAFHSRCSSQAQLIFTTHNTYPLRKKMLRRDQVWFLNKMSDLSSQVVNFSEFKVRTDASYEKDYLNGRFGGIPSVEIPEIFMEDNS